VNVAVSVDVPSELVGRRSVPENEKFPMVPLIESSCVDAGEICLAMACTGWDPNVPETETYASFDVVVSGK
jgi:hypothetical protein